MSHDPSRETIGSVGIIREMLDHARNVDEALEVMESYNISMEDGPPIHYLVADRSGQAVLIEFYQGEMVQLPNEAPWHQATNFLRSEADETGGWDCPRYDRIEGRLAETGGQLSAESAMELLEEVDQPITQWSVVYGISSGEVQVSMGREYDDVHSFWLEPVGR